MLQHLASALHNFLFVPYKDIIDLCFPDFNHIFFLFRYALRFLFCSLAVQQRDAASFGPAG